LSSFQNAKEFLDNLRFGTAVKASALFPHLRLRKKKAPAVKQERSNYRAIELETTNAID
jgi:hypothetical protein